MARVNEGDVVIYAGVDADGQAEPDRRALVKAVRDGDATDLIIVKQGRAVSISNVPHRSSRITMRPTPGYVDMQQRVAKGTKTRAALANVPAHQLAREPGPYWREL